VQNAFKSDTLSAVDFRWNRDGTVLTVNPRASLEYASGTNPNVVQARIYGFQLTDAATDLAGNKLAPTASSFKTLRRIEQNLIGLPDLSGTLSRNLKTGEVLKAIGADALFTVGDSVVNAANTPITFRRKLFYSYSLSALPDGIKKLEAATLSVLQFGLQGSPFSVLGLLNLEHVSYAQFSSGLESAFGLGAFLRPLGPVMADDIGIAKLNVLVALTEDYDRRATRGNRSQYRLAFTVPSDANTQSDFARFTSVFTGGFLDLGASLSVKYLVP
jgi:hypothetical protein